MPRLRETIGWLLYQLSRIGWWKHPRFWENFTFRTYGYGQLDYNTGKFQFPVRCLEVTREHQT